MAFRALLALSALPLIAALSVHGVQERADEQPKANRTKRTGTCDCMSWAEVYYTNKAWCGRAFELYFLSKNGFSASYAATEPITGAPHKVCYDLFKNFLSPKCLNMDLYPFPVDEHSGKQWCYVSNDCPDLNGGGSATNQQGFAQMSWHNLQSGSFQSWKICDPDEANTEAMSVLPVSQVVDLGTYSDVPLSNLFRLSYPAVNISWGEAHFLWTAINDAYAPGLSVSDMVDSVPLVSGWGSNVTEVQMTLREIAKSEKGTVLDSPGHGDNFHVVQGRAAYSVTRIELGNMAYLGGHFAREYVVECLMGCAESESRDAVDLDTM